MVPFTLRLLHAQLPAYQNSIQLSLDRLCELQSVCERILAELNHSRLPNQPHPLTSHDQQGNLIYGYFCKTKSCDFCLRGGDVLCQISWGGGVVGDKASCITPLLIQK